MEKCRYKLRFITYPGHHRIIREAAKDKRVARIFVFPGAKVQMCKDEKGNRAYLRKIRPWYGHHYHFHVRLACPKGVRGCVNQTPPPRGDGCADAREWQRNILNPPPPDPNPPKRKPRRELVLADLPAHCTLITVIDGHPATLAWLGAVHGHRTVPLGVEHFGQTGTVQDLYRHFGLDSASIARSANNALRKPGER